MGHMRAPALPLLRPEVIAAPHTDIIAYGILAPHIVASEAHFIANPCCGEGRRLAGLADSAGRHALGRATGERVQLPGESSRSLLLLDGNAILYRAPDKDFFQIISPQLCLLRFVPRGSGIVPFGVKEFQERFGDIHPSQYLEVLALQGDRVDSIPGLPGVGEITALKLVKEFKTVENLLQNREKVKLKRPRMSLMADDGGVLLSTKLLTLRTDISNHLVPHTLEDLLCQSPKDKGEQFVALVNAMGAYVDSSISEDILDCAAHLWEKWDSSMESIL